MVTTLRRLFWLALLGGAGYAGWAVWSSRREPAVSTGSTTLPPADPVVEPVETTPPVVGAAEIGTKGATPADAPWVAPTDGVCPLTHPVKLNESSGIFHLPGGRFYERTKPERCYITPEAAEADGYRKSKS